MKLFRFIFGVGHDMAEAAVDREPGHSVPAELEIKRLREALATMTPPPPARMAGVPFPAERAVKAKPAVVFLRQPQATIAYDPVTQQLYIDPAGKSGQLRLNGKPLASPAVMAEGDELQIGETTLLFTTLSNPAWTQDGPETDQDIAIA